MRRITEVGGKRMPVLRWSFLRMTFGIRGMTTNGQVGDGRETALADYVLSNARPGDVDDAIRVVDEFCYSRSWMMNVGDEKGALLDDAVRHVQPNRVLELGTYCGYSALRIGRAMSEEAHLYSIEFNPDNAAVARRILDHAGIGGRVTVMVGSLGDGGDTVTALENQHGFTQGSVDLVFLDHDKYAYLPDLERIRRQEWLRPGAVVVADNVKVPGVPGYREYMREREGREWRTIEHEAHLEYQSLIPDLVLESEYLPDARPA